MHNNDSVDYSKIRKKVSNLFIGVLTKRLPVREALLRFPKNCEDKTIIVSWHALCHLEADEELRRKDELYRKEQDDYIEFISYTLSRGEELPANIINEYNPYYKEALTPLTNKNSKGIWQQLKRFLCC